MYGSTPSAMKPNSNRKGCDIGNSAIMHLWQLTAEVAELRVQKRSTDQETLVTTQAKGAHGIAKGGVKFK